MARKKEGPFHAVAPRPSMDFAGLAAAIAFIAGSPSAAAVTERSADQFHQGACSPGAGLVSSSCGADAGAAKSFRLAQSQSTQSTQDEDDEDDEDTGQSGFGAFHFEYLPSDQNTLELWYDFQNEVAVDMIPSFWGPPYEHGLRNRMYGPGGLGVRCLVRGGAVMFSLKARRLGCWASAKAAPIRGLKVPRLDPSAQRVLASCRIATRSVTLRNGAFACIPTPLTVARMAAKGANGGPRKPPPVTPAKAGPAKLLSAK